MVIIVTIIIGGGECYLKLYGVMNDAISSLKLVIGY
jgi:hypothetical protein